MEAVIHHKKAGDVIWNNKTYLTNVRVQIPWGDAMRLSRIFDVEISTVSVHPYNPLQWADRKMFGFMGDADSTSGFGNCTSNLIKYSSINKYDVRWIGTCYNNQEMQKYANREIPGDIAMVWHEQPKHTWSESQFEKNIAIVRFET
ncbi:MAG: hypothetical protein ACYDBV_13975, partial [Nitrospiria bacterium]